MTRAIQSILIANRGEIAVRIIGTCRAMGIRTVTVYSDDDAELPHARLADAAYPLGSGRLAETYLNPQKIVAIAREAGADGGVAEAGATRPRAGEAKAATRRTTTTSARAR